MTSIYTCYILVTGGKIIKHINRFKFLATVSDRGQIFIPKVLQDYFRIRRRDKVIFVVKDDGRVIFRKKRKGDRQ